MKIKHLAVALGLMAATLSQVNADRLVIKGSDTLGAKLVPQLAEQFKAQHPGTTFDIAAEGSTTGIAAIIDGTAEIGMTSNQHWAIAPNSPECLCIQTSIPGSRLTEPGNRISWLMAISFRRPNSV